jgi:hypothetical protein
MQPNIDAPHIMSSAWIKFPVWLPERPIFYPLTNEEYAIKLQGIGVCLRLVLATEQSFILRLMA